MWPATFITAALNRIDLIVSVNMACRLSCRPGFYFSVVVFKNMIWCDVITSQMHESLWILSHNKVLFPVITFILAREHPLWMHLKSGMSSSLLKSHRKLRWHFFLKGGYFLKWGLFLWNLIPIPSLCQSPVWLVTHRHLFVVFPSWLLFLCATHFKFMEM